MIYRIAHGPPEGKGLVGVYPAWDRNDGPSDARFLESGADLSILFTRNYPARFFERIHERLLLYGRRIDIICGWEPEKLYMSFRPFNPEVEAFPISAMQFNTFDLIARARDSIGRAPGKLYDIFIAPARRPDGLKRVSMMVRLLAGLGRPVRIVGYGNLSAGDLSEIRKNTRLDLTWKGKARPTDPDERRRFLEDLGRSRCLLVTSKAEGYCRLAGEALLLGVSVLAPSDILWENWVHLNRVNCRLFTEGAFEAALGEMLSRDRVFDPPRFEDGNQLLKRLFGKYLSKRSLPEPVKWRPLGFGALNDCMIGCEGEA